MSALARLKATIAEEQAQNAATHRTGKTSKRPFEPFAGSKGGPVLAAFSNEKPVHCLSELPDEYALPLANLSNSPAPGDYDETHWRDALDGMEAFCAQWAGRARALGWRSEELFDLHPIAPAARHDKRGLALSLGKGARVVGIDCDGADILTSGGASQRFYRSARQ